MSRVDRYSFFFDSFSGFSSFASGLRHAGALGPFRHQLLDRRRRGLGLRRVDRRQGHPKILLRGDDALGEPDVRKVKRIADPEGGDVEFEKLGNGVGRALDLEAAGDHVEDAAHLDADRLPLDPQRDLDAELPAERHLVEIDVGDPAGQGMGLGLLQDRERLLPVGPVLHGHLDDHRPAAGRVEELFEGLALELDRPGLEPLAVDDAGDLPLGATLPVDLFPRVLAAVRRQLHHRHLLSPLIRTAS